MRGGAQSGGDPLGMAGSDYAELCDLAPSRWSSRGGGGGVAYHQLPQQQQQPPTHHSSVVGGGGHVRSNSSSFEAEDLGVGPYGVNSRIGNSTTSLRGRSGLYYSPPGTSYTIVERPHSPSYYFNSAPGAVESRAGGKGSGSGMATSLPARATYLGSSSSAIPSSSGGANRHSSSNSNMNEINNNNNTSSSASNHHHHPHHQRQQQQQQQQHGHGHGTSGSSSSNKKRPISPEQVIRLFGTTSSSSMPTSSSQQPYTGNGSRGGGDRGRRSPASSPPSMTHQLYRERDRSVPNIHELSTRTVSMSRDQLLEGGQGFGICVKGGRDAGVGVYISRVEEGSVAERSGLRAGDTILEVNGTPFTAIGHEEALKILKSSRQISMTVRAPPGGLGFLPTSSSSASATMTRSGSATINRETYPPPYRQACSWMDRHGRPASPPADYDGGRRHDRRIRRVELLIEPGQSLGLMIRGGMEYGLGIYITGVDKDSVADRAGLMIGDQLLEVNNQSFLEVTHDEAVSLLKYHKRMSLLVRDVGKVPHSCTTVEPEPWDPYSPTGTRSRRKCAASAMVEEKARSLLARHNFASLSYYIAEYSGRGMTIDAFVAVLLEMLDTPEKHSLVTEIRELVFPEDRSRFDELVYRRDPYRDNGDRLRSRGTVVINGKSSARSGTVVTDQRARHPNESHESGGSAVTDLDIEVTKVTGKSPSEDSGLGMGVTDIRQRPPLPLPYRPQSAGPILRPHYSQYHHHRLTTGSHNNLRDFMRTKPGPLSATTTANLGGSMGMGPLAAPSPQVHQNQPSAGQHHNHHHNQQQLQFLQHHPHHQQQHQAQQRLSNSVYGRIESTNNQDYNCDESSRIRRRGSETHIPRSEFDQDSDQGSYLDGIRTQLGGLTQRVKSWYWGRPLELATKLSRSFDMKEESGALLGGNGNVRRHQSMQRLSLGQNGDHMAMHNAHGGRGHDGMHHHGGSHGPAGGVENGANIVPDHRGNLHVTVKKSKPILGIAIEGGANTKHPLPRIINIHENGAAFEAGGLEVGQLILKVDGHKVEGMHHQEVARMIAECYASREKPDITFLVVEAKKSNMEPKPTALIFLEA